jgi:hypothetical protein
MIDRRPTATTPRTVVEHTHDLLTAMHQPKMPASRCHEHPARPDNHAIGRLHDPHSRHPGEPFGKAGRELGRNVLHDEDRHWKIGGQEWDHRPQSLGATGGRTDHDGIEASGRGGPGPPRWRRQRRGHSRSPHALPYGGQLLCEFSLDHVAGVAGYVHAQSGKHYVVIALLNHTAADTGPGQELGDALLSWAWAQ